MATITRVGTPSISTTTPCPAHHVSGVNAGEAIAAGDTVYIASTGLVMKATGTAANAAAKTRGMVFQAAAIGEGVSIYSGVNVRYGSGMTPGTSVFQSATAGLIDDAATTGGTVPIGYVIDATRIRIFEARL